MGLHMVLHIHGVHMLDVQKTQVLSQYMPQPYLIQQHCEVVELLIRQCGNVALCP